MIVIDCCVVNYLQSVASVSLLSCHNSISCFLSTKTKFRFSIYVGNKCDLEENRQVELSEADAMCEYFPELLSVLETSAKENKNIEEAFVTIASELKVCVRILLFGNCSFNKNFYRDVMTKVLI